MIPGLLLAFFLVCGVVDGVPRSSDYCRFDEGLKAMFRGMACSGDVNECARKARQIAQENLSGRLGTRFVISPLKSAGLPA
jgi:hypothetical protein